jgi:GMP synthase-like glutamine amidotransferase
MTLRLAVLEHEPETGLGSFARSLDAANVEYEVLRTHRRLSALDEFDGAIVLGASLSVDDVALDSRRQLGASVLRGLPCLAICLGAQLLADALGAKVARAGVELGVHPLDLADAAHHDPLFAGLPHRVPVFSFHQDRFELPKRAIHLAGSKNCAHHAFRFGAAAYGLQFHPELGRDDLDRWRSVPGYRRLVEESGEDWDELATALECATEPLGGRLLDRWLHVTAAVKALREGTPARKWGRRPLALARPSLDAHGN